LLTHSLTHSLTYSLAKSDTLPCNVMHLFALFAGGRGESLPVSALKNQQPHPTHSEAWRWSTVAANAKGSGGRSAINRAQISRSTAAVVVSGGAEERACAKERTIEVGDVHKGHKCPAALLLCLQRGSRLQLRRLVWPKGWLCQGKRHVCVDVRVTHTTQQGSETPRRHGHLPGHEQRQTRLDEHGGHRL